MIATPRNTAMAKIALVLPIWAIARNAEVMPLWQAAVIMLIIGGAFWTTLAYLSAIRKAHAASMLARPVWWSILIGGHCWRMILAILPALLTGLGVVAMVLNQGVAAVVWIALCAVLVQIFARVFAGRIQDDIRPFARNWAAITLATSITAAVLTVTSVLWVVVPSAPGSVDLLFSRMAPYQGPSTTIALMADWVAFLSGAQAMAERTASEQGLPLAVILIWRITATFGYFMGLALACAAPLITSAEARRILAPTDAETPGPVGAMSAAVGSAIAVIFAVLLLQLLARIEAITSMAALIVTEDPSQPAMMDSARVEPLVAINNDIAQPRLPSPLSPAGLRRQIPMDIIDNLECPPGTITAIEAADAELRDILAGQEYLLEIAISTGFDGVRSNVPGFLDWYYSLTAEYLRMGNLLIGSGSEYLDAKLRENLDVGSPLQDVEGAIAMLSANPILAGEHGDRRRALLASCGLAIPRDDALVVAADVRSDDLLTTDLHVGAEALKSRVSASLGGAVAGTAVAAILVKIGAKALMKGIVTLAAETLAKIAGAKALSLGGGILTGAVTGGASGSVIPGAGTAVGAIIGGVVGGVTVMIAVDYSLLKLDEAVSRPDFQAEIIAAIDESEHDLLADLGMGQD